MTKKGRPRSLNNKKQYQVTLDEETVNKARDLGAGNLSNGIRMKFREPSAAGKLKGQ